MSNWNEKGNDRGINRFAEYGTQLQILQMLKPHNTFFVPLHSK